MEKHSYPTYQELVRGRIKFLTFEEAQDYLDSLGVLRFVLRYSIDDPYEQNIRENLTTPEEFIKLFMRKYKNEKATSLFKDNLYVTNNRTTPGRRRSIVDIYLITKNFFENITLKEVYSIVLNDFSIYGSYCSVVKRLVYYIPFIDNTIINGTDELGFTVQRLFNISQAFYYDRIRIARMMNNGELTLNVCVKNRLNDKLL